MDWKRKLQVHLLIPRASATPRATTSIGHSGRLEIEGRVPLRRRLRHRRVPLGGKTRSAEKSEKRCGYS